MMWRMWNAVLWGALASAALYLGQLLAQPLEHRPRATGLIMGSSSCGPA